MPPLVTAQQLERLDNQSHRYDLIRGELMEQDLGDFEHGAVAASIAAILSEFVYMRSLGVVVIGAGFWLARDPDTFLAVEVVAQSDRLGSVMKIAQTYLDYGVRCLWIVDPVEESVAVWSPISAPRILRRSNILDGGELLPGFSIRVGAIFEN
jgi:Putative restriction endonuclease